jgi:hypothetical protein
MTEEERQAKMASLARCRAQAEKYYDDMYEAHSFRDANDCYREAKDFLYEAIKFAGELGLPDEEEAVMKRLEHIKGVFRSQFVQ